ncbi:MAG TPA: hypothetical protein VGC58_02795 [Candidatus Paceibacterota bacterium]
MENREDTQIIPRSLFVFNMMMVISIISLVFIIYTKDSSPEITKADQGSTTTEPVFKDVSITAKSAYVYDIYNKKVLYKKNEFEQLPLASITKLMMAVTAVELFPKETEIIVRSDFLKEEGDSGLVVNESWKLKDLLDFSLVVSSNDGARSVASVIGAFKLNTTDYDMGRKEFIRQMNIKSQNIGLKNTYFVNENGLDIEGTSGGYGSAIDVANLLSYILQNEPEILEATKFERIDVSSSSKNHTGKNTNKDVGEFPGIIASKTGFTDMAGGNLALAFDASMERPIVVVVLGSTEKDRFKDVKTLVDASIEYINK